MSRKTDKGISCLSTRQGGLAKQQGGVRQRGCLGRAPRWPPPAVSSHTSNVSEVAPQPDAARVVMVAAYRRLGTAALGRPSRQSQLAGSARARTTSAYSDPSHTHPSASSSEWLPSPAAATVSAPLRRSATRGPSGATASCKPSELACGIPQGRRAEGTRDGLRAVPGCSRERRGLHVSKQRGPQARSDARTSCEGPR